MRLSVYLLLVLSSINRVVISFQVSTSQKKLNWSDCEDIYLSRSSSENIETAICQKLLSGIWKILRELMLF